MMHSQPSMSVTLRSSTELKTLRRIPFATEFIHCRSSWIALELHIAMAGSEVMISASVLIFPWVLSTDQEAGSEMALIINQRRLDLCLARHMLKYTSRSLRSFTKH